jgi:hypothetical protein
MYCKREGSDPSTEWGRDNNQQQSGKWIGDEAGSVRKPFGEPLPNIEPLPGEPPKWWNP